jgi:hypothetical protein
MSIRKASAQTVLKNENFQSSRYDIYTVCYSNETKLFNGNQTYRFKQGENFTFQTATAPHNTTISMVFQIIYSEIQSKREV